MNLHGNPVFAIILYGTPNLLNACNIILPTTLSIGKKTAFMETNKKINMAEMPAPKLRFKEFDGVDKINSYKKHLFKDIFLFSTGKNIKQSEASPQFETPCVRYGELYHMYNEIISEVFNRTNIDKSELQIGRAHV